MPVQMEIDRLLAHRAAEWLEVLKTGGEAERRGFDAWLRESPRHMQHFLEMVALTRAMGELKPKGSEDLEGILKRIAPQAISHQDRRRELLSASGPVRPSGLSHRLPFRLAAVLATATLLLGLFLATRPWPPWPLWPSDTAIQTAVGEQRSVTLDDGSRVTLNTASEIRIDYSATQRQVDLNSGEAVFKVAADPARPFAVRTRLATIEAIGTQFNVYQRAQDARVSVLEGRVRVSTPEGQHVETLAAGEEVRVLRDGRILRAARADVAKSVSWRERRLSFDAAPLEEMVAEFNRYNERPKLRLEHVPANAYRFGGIYDADDPESLALILGREPGLVVERRGEDIVVKGRE